MALTSGQECLDENTAAALVEHALDDHERRSAERHLDAAWTEFLASELRHLADEENRCIVVASHSDIITQACDEVVQL